VSILGYDPEEMIGRSATDFIYPDDLETARNIIRLAHGGRQTRNFAIRYVHKDGRPVALTWTGAWSEPAQQYLFIGRDMTEERLAEEKFHMAVEASPSGLVMIDGSGAIVLVNAETERLFGYDRHELIGQPVDILVPVRQRGHHSRLRADFTAQPEARRMGAGRDLYGQRKDGSEFPVEIGLNPIQTQNGHMVLSVIVDITERKRAEAAIREYSEREQLFIAAVESSNDAIVTKALDGVITGWNRAAERLFGYSSAEAIGNRIDIIVPDELRGEVQTILAKIKMGEKVDHHETIRVDKNGQRIDVSLSVSPVKSQSGVIIGAAKVARDISARKIAQEALLESERMARAIIDTALDAFVQLDASGTIIGWSPKAEKMFGWSQQEVARQKLGDLIIPAANRAAYSERIAQFLRGA
jgi:PAS domain S-box-containing protein